MRGVSHHELHAIVLTFDASATLYVVAVAFLCAVAATALLSKGKRLLEILMIFFLTFAAFVALIVLFLHGVIDRPLYRTDWVKP